MGGADDHANAALMHDAATKRESSLIEIRSAFGDAVALIVADCTGAWVERAVSARKRSSVEGVGCAKTKAALPG